MSVVSTFTRRQSLEDASINWTRPAEVGSIETRYVRRCLDYFVIYVSSQTGCTQGCRMCHLTATGQTQLRHVTPDEILDQVGVVLDYYVANAPPARTVHFNFMARGEALANPMLLTEGDMLLGELAQRAIQLNLRPRYLISTIFPKEMGNRLLEDIFLVHHPEIYYSIYSMEDRFRRRWLPKSLPVHDALDRLKSWQQSTAKIPKIHYAFIQGENDSETDVHAICDAIEMRRLTVNVNIVRYNPQNPDRHGVEPPESIIQRNAHIFETRLPNAEVRVIPRVGFDVKASCGMFLTPDAFEKSPPSA